MLQKENYFVNLYSTKQVDKYFKDRKIIFILTREQDMKGIFITGTGTDIGKSVVSAGLLRNLRKTGIDAVPMKPIQSGAEKNETGNFFSGDIALALKASKYVIPDDEVTDTSPYLFEMACSPHLAAALSESRYPDMNRIDSSFRKLKRNHDFVIVEGAGGVSVPISDEHTTVDLIKKLDIPVLLVISNQLGCIDHAINSINMLKQNDIKIACAVMTHTTAITEDNAYIRKDNPRTIENFTGVEITPEVKYVENFNPENESTWAQIDSAFTGICRKIKEGQI